AALRAARWEFEASTCGPGSSAARHTGPTGRYTRLAAPGQAHQPAVARLLTSAGRPAAPIVWGMSDTSPSETPETPGNPDFDAMARDIAEVPAVEVIVTVAVNLMSAAAVKLGLTEER